MISSSKLQPPIAFLLLPLLVTASIAVAQDEVSFNRDVRPILASKCFACHGPDDDHRQADLRLDQRDSAVDSEAIVPGRPDESQLVDRLFSEDEDVVMPPPHSGLPLTTEQKLILKRWVAAGAKYQKHWAFEPPVATAPPNNGKARWLGRPIENPIDGFVLQKIQSNGMQPNQSADRATLVRRVYLDLIGLPPTVDQADAFINSKDPQAYEKLVDQLLASPRYGERWAQPWLDLARYSDTNGYEKDRERSIWPFRDWVIRSLNADMPYDQFSIEQLAGDMLEDPTADQLIATGFHRNTMLNEEGGIDPLEYRFLTMVDRVATTGTVWMGLTIGCAQCHTHKYDPISHTDYYRMMALMNNADEPDFQIPDEKKMVAVEVAKSEIEKLEMQLADKFPSASDKQDPQSRKSNLEAKLSKWIASNQKRSDKWDVIRPSAMKTNLPKLEVLDDGSIFASGDITKRDVYELEFDLEPGSGPIRSFRLEALPDSRLPDGGPGKTYYEGRKGDFFLSEISAKIDGQPVQFVGATESYTPESHKDPKKLASNVFDGDGSSGWKPGKRKATRLQLVLNLKEPISKPGKIKFDMIFERYYAASLGRFRFSTTSSAHAKANRLDEDIEQLLATKPRDQWTDAESNKVERAFLLSTPLLAEARKDLDRAKSKFPKLNQTMVFQERPNDHLRTTHRHHRGEYLNPKEVVAPGIPDLFVGDDLKGSGPASRLEFARWLVSDSNPLAARVAVNRAWREIFGAGLARTNGDFGVQSPAPTHTELLDWLAVKFSADLSWSNKKLHRLLVTSQTYRQSSQRPLDEVSMDPDNRLLARGPHFRVSGEMVRDIALQATGKLSNKMFGKGVRPPQPDSVTELAYGKTKWRASRGVDRFRRSIYTFKKRTASFAAYAVFDGPSGEVCTAKRNRSNTPLQALTVLNDEMYLEFARTLAKTTAERGFDSVDQSLVWIFRSFLTRRPAESELAQLRTYYADQLDRIGSGELDAEKIGGKGSSGEQAALSMVARVVMNLDETLSKR